MFGMWKNIDFISNVCGVRKNILWFGGCCQMPQEPVCKRKHSISYFVSFETYQGKIILEDVCMFTQTAKISKLVGNHTSNPPPYTNTHTHTHTHTQWYLYPPLSLPIVKSVFFQMKQLHCFISVMSFIDLFIYVSSNAYR